MYIGYRSLFWRDWRVNFLRRIDFKHFFTDVSLDLIKSCFVHQIIAEPWVTFMANMNIHSRCQEEDETPITKESDRSQPIYKLKDFL